jgi:uncharacterized delta-60 repeat protein
MRLAAKLLGFSFALAAVLVVAALPAFADPGELDRTFSKNGKATTDFGRDESAGGVAVQPDGRIVAVGGYDSEATGDDLAIARYREDGRLDPTFSADGRRALQIPDTALRASDVALQPDGRIVVVGRFAQAGEADFLAVRLQPDGGLDRSFSVNGRQRVDFDGGTDSAEGVAIQPDGGIVIAGDTMTAAGERDFAVCRLDTSGELDETFAADGTRTSDFGAADDVGDVALDDAGRIVVAGDTATAAGSDFAVARYESGGGADSSFGGGDGEQTASNGDVSSGNGVTVQENDKILVAGTSSTAGADEEFGLVRFNTGGGLDDTFGGDGRATIDFGAGYSRAYSVAVQEKARRIVAVGVAGNGDEPGNFAIAGYRLGGGPDLNFSGNGRVTTNFGGNDAANDVALPEGSSRIVAAGKTIGTGGSDFAVARYRG